MAISQNLTLKQGQSLVMTPQLQQAIKLLQLSNVELSEYIEREHDQLPVGERSALRAQLVSDRWLAAVGEAAGIEAVQRIGAKAKGDAAGQATLRAEAAEALIGAIYQGWGSLEPVHRWLTPHWQRTSAAVLADPHKGNAKSALQEWSQARKLGLPSYDSREANQRHGDP